MNNKSWLNGVVAAGFTSSIILGAATFGGESNTSAAPINKVSAQSKSQVKELTPVKNTSKESSETFKKIKDDSSNKVSRKDSRKSIILVKAYLVDGGEGKTYTVEKNSTVNDLLKKVHVNVTGDDKISVDKNSKIKEDMVISISRISKKEYTKNVSKDFGNSESTLTSNCTDGSVNFTPGVKGLTIEKWIKITTNNLLTSDSKVSESVKSKPKNSLKVTCDLPEISSNSNNTSNSTSSNNTNTSDNSTQITSSNVTVTGSKADWMKAAGISESDYAATDWIISRESGWNPSAINASSGACGLVQSLPCSKLGSNWNEPVTALKWFKNYANSRYGSISAAQNFWRAHNWY